jgi:hypothetical protein
MKYRYEFRSASGKSCCKSDSIELLCDKCRALANAGDHQSRAAAERVPVLSSLIELVRTGPKPHESRAPLPEPRSVVRVANIRDRERMPSPASMADLYKSEANR